MTTIDNPVTRKTANNLTGLFGKHRGRPLVVTLVAGDRIRFRPYKTQQEVSISLFDVYQLALQNRAERDRLKKAKARKEKKALKKAGIIIN